MLPITFGIVRQYLDSTTEDLRFYFCNASEYTELQAGWKKNHNSHKSLLHQTLYFLANPLPQQLHAKSTENTNHNAAPASKEGQQI